MKRLLVALVALAALWISQEPGRAQEKLVVSIWGGSWRDLIAETAAKKFKQETGVPVEFITGGTIDRLNKAKLVKKNSRRATSPSRPRMSAGSTPTTGCSRRSTSSKDPEREESRRPAKISPFHIGTWAYIYTIGYRPDLMKDVKFESWEDLWKPELKGKLAAPDFDPSHIIVVAAILSGGDAGIGRKARRNSRS